MYLKVFRGEMNEHVHRGTGQDLIYNFGVGEHHQTTG